MDMGKRLTGNFDQQHVDGFEAMQEDDKADSYSESVRRASIVGLRQMGYINGQSTDTRLKSWTRQAGQLLFTAGLVGLVMTFAYPVSVRLPSLSVMVAGVALYYPVHAAVSKREPQVSNRLRRLFGGDKA